MIIFSLESSKTKAALKNQITNPLPALAFILETMSHCHPLIMPIEEERKGEQCLHSNTYICLDNPDLGRDGRFLYIRTLISLPFKRP